MVQWRDDPMPSVHQHSAIDFHGRLAQSCISSSAAFLIDRTQVPRTYKTGPRYACLPIVKQAVVTLLRPLPVRGFPE